MSIDAQIAAELADLRRMPGIIRVPVHVWFPDDEAVAYARLGRLVRLIAGTRTRGLHAGLAPSRFRGFVSQGSQGRRHQVALWAHELPHVTPNEVFRTLYDGLDGAPLAVRFEFKGDDRFDLVFAIGTPGTADFLALVERRFSLASSTVEHYWMRVDASSQQRGMAARVIGALLPLYELMGVYTVRITAGLSVGGAVWGKFGFVPDVGEWNRMGPLIRVNIREVMLQGTIEPALREACEAADWLAGNPDPKNLWLINDLAADWRVGNERLGSVLLRGLRWKGSLSFSDSEAVNRLRDRLSVSGVSSSALDSLAAAALRHHRGE